LLDADDIDATPFFAALMLPPLCRHFIALRVTAMPFVLYAFH